MENHSVLSLKCSLMDNNKLKHKVSYNFHFTLSEIQRCINDLNTKSATG